MMIKLLLSMLILLPGLVQATHIYSGYISYTTDPQNPLRFHYVMTTYNYIPSPADDPFAFVDMGDGNTVKVDRSDYREYSKSYYVAVFNWTHTYAAAGNYYVSWTSNSRNTGILNLAPPTEILNFQIYTSVKAGNSLQNPNSAKLAGTGVVQLFSGEPWTHNLLAYDADGDYLTYDLVRPTYRSPTTKIAPVPAYQTPEGLTINEFGELHWANPGPKGDYVLNVRVSEFRNGIQLGYMIVEMTLIVADRQDHPQLSLVNRDRLTVNDDGSIQARPGEPLKLEFYLHNDTDSDGLSLRAKQFGEIDTLKLAETTLQFRDTTDGYALTYTVTPTQEMARTEPYLIGLRGWAEDNTPVDLYERSVEFVWAFAYVYIGQQRRPLSSGAPPEPGNLRPYPNPVKDAFSLQAPNLPALHLQVRDATGKVVATYQLQPGTNHLLRPARLVAGLYFYTLTSHSNPINSGRLVLQ